MNSRWCLLCVMLTASVACNQTVSTNTDSPSPASAVTVTTVKPERKAFRHSIAQPAYIEALEETPLLAHIAGYVKKVHVDIGDRVKGPVVDAKGNEKKPGQLLVEISAPEIEQSLKQKQALVVQAKAEVDQASAAVDAAHANVATAKAFIKEAEAAKLRALANCERWTSELKRVTALVSNKVIDAQTVDEARNQHKAAEATCQEVEAKIQSANAAAKESEAKHAKAKADLAAAKAKVLVAQAEEGRVAALLASSKVRAPYDGVIASRHVHTGHFLTGNGTKPLLVVARTDVVRVSVDVPEADAMYVSDGVPVKIRAQHIKDRDFEGKVTRSSWTLDAKARTLRTEIHLPNPEGTIRPGMYAYATFTAELPPTFTLPVSALITQGGETSCFIVHDGKAVLTQVKAGARDAQNSQVLKKRTAASKSGDAPAWQGFTGEEQIISTRVNAIADGQAVTMSNKK